MGRASRLKKERSAVVKQLRMWHYTTDQHLAKISETGIIKPTVILIGEKERPAAWFSTNPDWERSVTKKVILDEQTRSEPLQRDDMLQYGLTPVRIEINTSLVKVIDWKTYKRVSGITLECAKWLAKVGLEEGADPTEWYAVFDGVPATAWVSIDFWNGEEWISYPLGEQE